MDERTSMADDFQRLVDWLRDRGSALVAFSGGVDSSLLLAAAVAALGDRCLAVTVRSPLQAPGEAAAAEALARSLGARFEFAQLDELADERVRRNAPDRCYHCKQLRYSALCALAGERGLAQVLDGGNADDRGQYRPGMAARDALGVRAPLEELGLDKAAVRRLARAAGLANWDRPAAACLASRIPYQQPLEPARLARVARAEAAVAALGFGPLRVRDHGPLGLVELEPAALARALAARSAMRDALRRAGYTYAALDLAGLRSGSADEVLDLDDDG
jgi:uncharacterized protein